MSAIQALTASADATASQTADITDALIVIAVIIVLLIIIYIIYRVFFSGGGDDEEIRREIMMRRQRAKQSPYGQRGRQSSYGQRGSSPELTYTQQPRVEEQVTTPMRVEEATPTQAKATVANSSLGRRGVPQSPQGIEMQEMGPIRRA